MDPRQKAKKVQEALQRHGKFRDHPWQRISSLLLSMLADRTLPNVMVGAFLTSQIHYMAGVVPVRVRNYTLVAFIVTVLFHGIADEIKNALKALSEEVKEDEQTDRPYH